MSPIILYVVVGKEWQYCGESEVLYTSIKRSKALKKSQELNITYYDVEVLSYEVNLDDGIVKRSY
jgi:DNA/RNA endonuclease YhcR with UshA esterase domain